MDDSIPIPATASPGCQDCPGHSQYHPEQDRAARFMDNNIPIPAATSPAGQERSEHSPFQPGQDRVALECPPSPGDAALHEKPITLPDGHEQQAAGVHQAPSGACLAAASSSPGPSADPGSGLPQGVGLTLSKPPAADGPSDMSAARPADSCHSTPADASNALTNAAGAALPDAEAGLQVGLGNADNAATSFTTAADQDAPAAGGDIQAHASLSDCHACSGPQASSSGTQDIGGRALPGRQQQASWRHASVQSSSRRVHQHLQVQHWVLISTSICFGTCFSPVTPA